MPLPEFAKKTETFYSIVSDDVQQQSLCYEYDGGCFKFSSFDISVDENINHITRKYDTILSVVKDIGSIKVGAIFLLSLFTFFPMKYARDKALANALFYENFSKPDANRSDNEKALENLKYRQKFNYPTFCFCWCKRHLKQRRDKKLKFQ